MTRSELVNACLDYLKREGFRPELDADGDVTFRCEQRAFIVIVGNDGFVSLCYPNFWSIDSPDECWRALVAAQAATRACKHAKIFVAPSNKNTWATSEAFYQNPPEFLAAFPKSLRAVQFAVQFFVREMHASSGAQRLA